MNKNKTQFAVAIVGTAGLVSLAMAAVIGQMVTPNDTLKDLTFMLVGGVLSTASAAAAWLFRLNGADKNGGS